MKNKEYDHLLGEVGFSTALDKNGNRVSAWNANLGETYYCETCGIPMHRLLRQKAASFAKYAGTQHLKRSCRDINERSYRRIIPRNVAPSFFVGMFVRAAKESGGAKPKPGGGPASKGNGNKLAGGSDNPKELAFRTLNQFAESGIFLRDPYEKVGKYHLIDFIVHFLWMKELLKKTKNIGARIIWAKAEFYDPESQSIVFRVFEYSKRDGKLSFQVKFRVFFRNKVDYHKIKSKAFILRRSRIAERRVSTVVMH